MHDERELAARQTAQMAVFLKGDAQAVALCDQVFHLTQIWDDLVDGDKEVCIEDINRAFWLALVEIPQNPFFQRHQAQLTPLLRAAVADWMDAGSLEQGDNHERTLAFVLRDAVGGLVSQCAYLIGGYEWMRTVSPDVRRMVHDETLDTYLRRLP